MRSSMKRFLRLAVCLGLLGFASGLWADVIEHSGPILEDTVWRSSDEHLVSGDVTVYPQVGEALQRRLSEYSTWISASRRHCSRTP